MRLIVLCCIMIFIASESFSHRMDVAYQFTDGELIIEAWSGADEAVVDGEVTITANDGTIIHTGKTDAEGFYRWRPETSQDITVSVYAGEGHKKTVQISKEVFNTIPQQPHENTPSLSNQNSSKTSSIRVSTEDRFGTPERIVLGFTLLASLAAAWMSFRNSKKLTEIESIMKNREK
jgi:hypothetical protein